jgi:hypothetical protein
MLAAPSGSTWLLPSFGPPCCTHARQHRLCPVSWKKQTPPHLPTWIHAYLQTCHTCQPPPHGPRGCYNPACLPPLPAVPTTYLPIDTSVLPLLRPCVTLTSAVLTLPARAGGFTGEQRAWSTSSATPPQYLPRPPQRTRCLGPCSPGQGRHSTRQCPLHPGAKIDITVYIHGCMGNPDAGADADAEQLQLQVTSLVQTHNDLAPSLTSLCNHLHRPILALLINLFRRRSGVRPEWANSRALRAFQEAR